MISPTIHQALGKLASASNGGDEKTSNPALAHSSQDFVSVLLSKIIEPMFPKDDDESQLFGGGNGGEIYRGMFVDEFGKILAKNGVLSNVEQSIQKQLLTLQEAHHG